MLVMQKKRTGDRVACFYDGRFSGWLVGVEIRGKCRLGYEFANEFRWVREEILTDAEVNEAAEWERLRGLTRIPPAA